MTTTHPDIQDNLRALRLHYTADNFFEFTERLAEQSPGQVLEQLGTVELAERKRRTIQRRLHDARLGRFKTLDQFDWNWPEQIDRSQIQRLMALDFVDGAENVILLGAQGLGKTMIAKNLAWLAVQRGRTVLFTSISKMVTELAAAGHMLEAKFRRYAKPDILVLDELGYLAFQDKSADLLYEILARRHEQKSTVLTTNLAFKDWPEIFPGAACVVAMVDRLTHKAEIVRIAGKSYRQRESQQRQIKKEKL